MLIRISTIRRTHHEPVCDPVCSYTGAPNSGRRGAVFLQDVDRSQSAGRTSPKRVLVARDAESASTANRLGRGRMRPSALAIILASFRYASLRKNDLETCPQTASARYRMPARSLSLPLAPRLWVGVRKPSGNEPARGGRPVQRALWGFGMLGGCNAGAVIAATSALGLI